MNTYKTLKSFSLTSTKMWVGGRGSRVGVAQRDYAVECWTQASMSTSGLLFFLFPFFFCSEKQKSKKFVQTAEIPNNIPQSCRAIVWIVPIFQTDELYVPTVRPVVAGEDRLRFAKSIFLDFNSPCLERGRWNCKFYTTTIFFIEILSIQCVVGSPVNLLCTLLWETVETIYNI